MALIDKSEMEANLAAQHRKAAKFRTNHVGTKLNERELRGSAELEEITALRLLLINVLPKSWRWAMRMTPARMPKESWFH